MKFKREHIIDITAPEEVLAYLDAAEPLPAS